MAQIRANYARPLIVTSSPTHVVLPMDSPVTERMRVTNLDRCNLTCKVKTVGDATLRHNIRELILPPGVSGDIIMTVGIDRHRNHHTEEQLKFSFSLDPTNSITNVGDYQASTLWQSKTIVMKRVRFDPRSDNDALVSKQPETGNGGTEQPPDASHVRVKKKNAVKNGERISGHKYTVTDSTGVVKPAYRCIKQECSSDPTLFTVDSLDTHLNTKHASDTLVSCGVYGVCSGTECTNLTFRNRKVIKEHTCSGTMYLKASSNLLLRILDDSPSSALMIVSHLRDNLPEGAFSEYAGAYRAILDSVERELIERIMMIRDAREEGGVEECPHDSNMRIVPHSEETDGGVVEEGIGLIQLNDTHHSTMNPVEVARLCKASMESAKVGTEEDKLQNGRDFYKFFFTNFPDLRVYFKGAENFTADDVQKSERFEKQGQRLLLAVHNLAETYANQEVFKAYVRETINRHRIYKMDPSLWLAFFTVFTMYLETKTKLDEATKKAWAEMGRVFNEEAQIHLKNSGLPHV